MKEILDIGNVKKIIEFLNKKTFKTKFNLNIKILISNAK